MNSESLERQFSEAW